MDSFDNSQTPPAEITDEQALQDFLLDLDCLNDLSKWVSRFNVFDVLKVTRAEIRHSNMLAWLLDPSENHGLGGKFLEGVLRYIVRASDDSLPVFSVLTMDLNEFSILREWRNIDILAVSSAQRFVLCIENKIDSGEHGNQLMNYARAIDEVYPGYDKRFVFLSPSAIEPTASDRWIPMGYSEILSILESIVPRASLGDGARLLIENYQEIIRRDIVEDQELAEICQRIYAKHRRALDLIYENRPDKASALSEIFKDWAESKVARGEIEFDPRHSSKAYTRFHTPYLSSLLPDTPGALSGWNCPSHYFWEIISYRGDSFYLKLSFSSEQIPDDQRAMCALICETCREHDFGKTNRLNPNWQWRTQFSTKSAKVGDEIDEDKIRRRLDSFFKSAIEFEEKLKGFLDA